MTDGVVGSSLTGMAISTTTHFRVHKREALIGELHAFATDREHHGKHDRASAARKAAAELADGAPRVFFERCWYVVGDEPERYSAHVGTRAEVRAAVEEFGKGSLHLGREETAREAGRALAALAGSVSRVQVGHLVYEVIGE